MGPSVAGQRAIQEAMFETPQQPRRRHRHWKPRVFVTNDELRTCLSKNLLAPWIDRTDEATGSAKPSPLVAFSGPISVEALDAFGRRGPNAYWVGLELDASVLPGGATAPAAMATVMPFRCVTRIVFRSEAERERFEATPLANVALPTGSVTCDPSWFAPDTRKRPTLPTSGHQSGVPMASASERVDIFRRLYGGAIALVDGAVAEGTVAHALVGLTRPPGQGHLWGPRTDVIGASTLFGGPSASRHDAGVAAWRWTVGLDDDANPAEPLEVLDERVRRAVIEHLRASDEPILDQRALAEIVESTAAACMIDERLRPAAERYPKAVTNLRRLWRNEIGWRALLDIWPEGFPTLQAILLVGSVLDADRFGVLRTRVGELGVPMAAAQLARFFFGLRWGIESIPITHRGPREHQHLLEATIWSVPPLGDGDVERRSEFSRGPGRTGARPYALELHVAGADARLDVPLATVVRAKFARASRTAPDPLRHTMLALAVKQRSAHPFLTPPRRGQPKAWADWPGFERAVMAKDGILTGLKGARDLWNWGRSIDEVLAQVQGTP
jgi:hypothetical protein